MQIHDRYKGYFFILPAFILLVSILGFPAIAAILQSFNLMWVSKPSFTISSYLRLFQDAEFLGTLVNTIIFVSTTVSFHLLIGLGVALLLNLEIKRRHVFRVIAILPWTMPDVIGGLIWKFIFDTLPGFVNGVLIRGGMLAEPIDFFGTPLLAFCSFIFAEIWRGLSFRHADSSGWASGYSPVSIRSRGHRRCVVDPEFPLRHAPKPEVHGDYCHDSRHDLGMPSLWYGLQYDREGPGMRARSSPCSPISTTFSFSIRPMRLPLRWSSPCSCFLSASPICGSP